MVAFWQKRRSDCDLVTQIQRKKSPGADTPRGFEVGAMPCSTKRTVPKKMNEIKDKKLTSQVGDEDFVFRQREG